MTPHIKQLHTTKTLVLVILFNSAVYEQASGVQQSQGQGTVSNNVVRLSLTRICVVPFTQGPTPFH